MSIADKINLAVAAAAGVSALIALLYTVVTYRILSANRAIVEAMHEQTVAQVRPYVQIAAFLRTGTQLFYLSIRNTGKSPAWNLRLVMDHDFFSFGNNRPDRNIRSFAAFTQPIECFPPNSEMRFNLGVGPDLFADDADRKIIPLVFEIAAQYEFSSSTVTERTMVDLRPYLGAVVPDDPIADELAKIKESLDEIRKKVGRDA